MGCFLGCFGLSCKRKRRRPANRVQPGDHRVGSYEPLDSASANLDVLVEPINSESELSNKKPKETLNYKIRKKVSFNLNVQTYEPIPAPESDEEEDKEETTKETTKEADPMASYPPNYRYGNCIGSYDEEDEIAYDDSDLDDDDEDDDNDLDDSDSDICEPRISHQQVFVEQFDSLSVSSQTLTGNARDRSRYVDSVLNPVENLSQWKAVKAKGMPPEKRQKKENVPLEPLQQKHTGLIGEVAVDASLSNWLVSSRSHELKPESITKFNSNVPSVKTSSLKNREDMPILDITNLFGDQNAWQNAENRSSLLLLPPSFSGMAARVRIRQMCQLKNLYLEH